MLITVNTNFRGQCQCSRIQQTNGIEVVCLVTGSPTFPPGCDRGIHRGEEKEGG